MKNTSITPEKIADFCDLLPAGMPVLLHHETGIGVITAIEDDVRARGTPYECIRCNALDRGDVEELIEKDYWQKPGVVVLNEAASAPPYVASFIVKLVHEHLPKFNPASRPMVIIPWDINHPLTLSSYTLNRIAIAEVRRPE